MNAPFTATNSIRRRHQRHAVQLDCQLTFTDRTAHARVVDLSMGGAKVRMPLHVSLYDFDTLSTLHIRQIGLVRVGARWFEDHHAGLEFHSPDMIRQSLARYLATLDPRPALRPIGG